MHYPIKIVTQKRFPENHINIWFCIFLWLRIKVIEKIYNSYRKNDSCIFLK